MIAKQASWCVSKLLKKDLKDLGADIEALKRRSLNLL
jgi:hypothetical protein